MREPHLRRCVLKLHGPLSFLLWPVVGYTVLWCVAPISFVSVDAAAGFSLFVGLVLALSIGARVGFARWRPRTVQLTVNVRRHRRLTRIVAALGLAGLALKGFERIFLRAGGAVSADFVANRDLIAQGGSGLLAFGAALLAALLLVLPLFFHITAAAGIPQRSAESCVYRLIFIVNPLFDLALMGSRSTAVIALGIWLTSALTTGQLRFSWKGATRAAVIGLVLVWATGEVFWVRTTQMGLDPVISMYTSSYAMFAPAQTWVIESLSGSAGGGFAGLMFALVHFCQYLLHGIYEFLFIAANVDAPRTGGMQTFYIPAKALLSLTTGEAIEPLIAAGQLRPGVYTTFFGPLVYDFGPYGAILASALCGWLLGWMSRSVARGNSALLPFHLVGLTFLGVALTVNLFASATGQFLMISIGMLWALQAHRSLRAYRIRSAR